MKLKTLKTILVSTAFYAIIGCSGNKLEEKGFPVSTSTEDSDEDKVSGISKDSLILKTKPSNVLLTGMPRYRLTTIYKVNYNKDKTTFIGANDFHFNYEDFGRKNGNQWNYNYMPGLEAVYGYNMVNVSHYDTTTQKQKQFFEKPVLIKTLYYPSFSKDSLNYKPIILLTNQNTTRQTILCTSLHNWMKIKMGKVTKENPFTFFGLI